MKAVANLARKVHRLGATKGLKMTENKNYCVGGKCTITDVDEQRCTFWKPGRGLKFCTHEKRLSINCYECTSQAANAESKDGEE